MVKSKNFQKNKVLVIKLFKKYLPLLLFSTGFSYANQPSTPDFNAQAEETIQIITAILLREEHADAKSSQKSQAATSERTGQKERLKQLEQAALKLQKEYQEQLEITKELGQKYQELESKSLQQSEEFKKLENEYSRELKNLQEIHGKYLNESRDLDNEADNRKSSLKKWFFTQMREIKDRAQKLLKR